jgi:hypothetical protein
MAPRQWLVGLALALVAGGGCASTRKATVPPSHRIPDSASERLTGLREANPEVKAETVEKRFAAEKARERQEAARAAADARQRRVDVVEPKKKPPQK